MDLDEIAAGLGRDPGCGTKGQLYGDENMQYIEHSVPGYGDREELNLLQINKPCSEFFRDGKGVRIEQNRR